MADEDKTVEMTNGSWWGVDSFTPATEKWGGSKTLYDYLVETINFDSNTKTMPEKLRRPAFWGRYLLKSRNPLKPGGALTKGEIDDLHALNCRILPVYNGNMPDRSQKFDQGRADADAAIKLAMGVGIPQNVCIYLNVDSQFKRITPEYILGWWSNMLGNTTGSDTGHLSYARVGLYCALNIEESYSCALDYMYGIVHPWKPWKPKDVPDIRQFVPVGPFCNIWAGWNWVGSTVAGKPPDFNPPRYNSNPGATGIWQYTTNKDVDQMIKIGTSPAQLIQLRINGKPVPVDLNLASQRGFDLMF